MTLKDSEQRLKGGFGGRAGCPQVEAGPGPNGQRGEGRNQAEGGAPLSGTEVVPCLGLQVTVM
jgi:hypothetical protein